MKSFKHALWAGFAAAVLNGTASAQVDTSGGTTTGSTSGPSVTGLGNASLGGSNGLGNNAAASTAGNAITITPPSQIQSTSSLNASNTLGRYYANPAYQGRAGTQGTSITNVTNPGGFGTALYGNAGTGATGAGRAGGGTAPTGVGGGGGFTAGTSTTGATGFGATAGRTGTTGATGFGATGTTGGFGATAGRTTGALGGAGGAGGGAISQQNSGLISPRAIAYTATYRFPVAAIVPAQQQLELRAMIDTSSQIVAPKGIDVQTRTGGVVVLTGRVADEDEARLVEGMMRLTPGVRDVKNELQFPKP